VRNLFPVTRVTGVRAKVGFALTVLYVVVTIISPEQFGPEWAKYHALMFLAVITFLFSVPSILTNRQLRSSIQTYLIVAFIIAIAISEITNGWIGGVVASWQVFLPSAAVFFFIVANVTSVHRLKVIAFATVVSCVAVVIEALCGYYGGFHGDMFVLRQSLYSTDEEVVGQLARLRGAGFLNDPNDLGQILLIALPLVFIVWKERRRINNSLMVYLPAVLLLWAVYLTHSRGALVALALIVLMVARKTMGDKTSVILVSALVLGLLAMDFTGGRGISTSEGAGRLEAWATGLELFKSAPLFGIGFGSFTDFNDITAHNSFVLCLAELGIVGSTLWVASLVTTMTSLNGIIARQEKRALMPPAADKVEPEEAIAFGECVTSPQELLATNEDTPVPNIDLAVQTAHQPDVPLYWVEAMRIALVSFVATGWFLSRGYKTPMYLVLGLATATIGLHGSAHKSRGPSRWVAVTVTIEGLAIVFLYGIVRLR
jgi:putative inorganic carbon (HCO3(-)) transporter